MSDEYPGQQITVHEGNIGEPGDCRRVRREVIDSRGGLDMLVNNAGITIDRTVAKMTDDDWQKVIAVNLSGAFFMAQAAVEHMIERGTGRIISVSSVIGETGNIGQANYAASKAGLVGLTKSLAREDVFQLSRGQRPGGDRRGDRAAPVLREAVSGAGVEPADVGHAVFGNVIHTEVRDMYLGRVAAVNGGLPVETPAFTLNRLCGSGLQAIVSAAQAIRLGDCDVAVAGGAGSMSRGQYWLPGMRWGQRMQGGVVIHPLVGALPDPFDACHMGVTAENVAADYGVSRADQDGLAAESHRRAAAAADAGYFLEPITPVAGAGKK